MMKTKWILKTLTGIAALTFATAANAGHRSDIYRDIKILDKETDHLLDHYKGFLRKTGAARSDRHYLALLGAIAELEKHADHVRSDFENGRGHHEIAREIARAKSALAEVDHHMHDHLKIPKVIDQDFHSVEAVLDDLARVYHRRPHDRHGYDYDHRDTRRGAHGYDSSYGHRDWRADRWSGYRTRPEIVRPDFRRLAFERARFGNRGLSIRIGR